MPPYLTFKCKTYYFRQGVPQELRGIVGKREIKRSLGRDYNKAVSECKRCAVEADNLLADARAQFDSLPRETFSRENIRRLASVKLKGLTPEIETQFGNLIRAALLESDREKRLGRMSPQELTEYGQTITDSLAAIRTQLATGHIDPMVASAQTFLTGRGYDPDFSEDEWRRLAFRVTEETLAAYEGMAARQRGEVVREGATDILPNQYELQPIEAANLVNAKNAVSWEKLYEIWKAECKRNERTEGAYLACLRLFQAVCPEVNPLTVMREHALKFRDYLLQEQGLSVATVANKVGFVGTIFNAGRNSTKYSSLLRHQPFDKIPIKEAKRGIAGKTRSPFSHAELKKIFTSRIYTSGYRPKGGAGEAAVWIPAIAYLTGANLEEIATLRKQQFEVDAWGNHYFEVGDSKNKIRAGRQVPLHPMLIQAGLLSYVSTCKDRLFPRVVSASGVESSAYSKWFGRYLDELQITSRSKVFHSFRHFFKDLCRNSRMADSAIDKICGHEPGTEGGKYGVGMSLEELSKLLAEVIPPVDLGVITPPK